MRSAAAAQKWFAPSWSANVALEEQHRAGRLRAELAVLSGPLLGDEDGRVMAMRGTRDGLDLRGDAELPRPEPAADTRWVLAAPDVARLLRQGKGWTTDDHATWLEDLLVRALLPDA